MEHWKNITIDDPALWPTDHLIKLDSAHVDARGSIQCLVNFPVKNISLITSRKGTVRSNHYHKTDWHYMYVLSGRFDYCYRPTGSAAQPTKVTLGAGEMVFTPPMEDHATLFHEDTTLIVMSRNPRDQEAYESDVVRVQLVDPATFTVK
ncbi:hypothetical protein Verru16b_02070 [Lacunisphaera limnophila]|uniref:Cupin type-2 domain-containing protein n=1 Tax=Lacunisphaera limnophila TaxID=1838286 RepID=A0A1D8AVU7_9BACT|nr:cupin domain-containing protein [Lacunisphaera limnophila]AOS45001.1 hypothetical protein Verru16b_02070 [Lacunisphaera limnophila]